MPSKTIKRSLTREITQGYTIVRQAKISGYLFMIYITWGLKYVTYRQ